MIPPDRTMFKTPQLNRDSRSGGQQLSSMEKLIRYAEKDDWLLYLTALFGILMPGIMYFFYKKAHNAYLKYSRTRAVILSIFTYEAAEKLEDVDPLVVKLADTDFSAFQFYKGLCMFVVSYEEEQNPPPECFKFFEFLKEAKFEKRQKDLLQNVSFSTFVFVSNEEMVENAANFVDNFKKQLRDCGGHEFCDSVFCHDKQIKEQFDVWLTEARYTAKRIGIKKPIINQRQSTPETTGSDTDASLISLDDTDHEKYD
uniref:Uncharacterized protein n=1 Tax=Panagrolaimus sp. JU765 TaxID=591449 RepID=A0AC34RIW6_9BILA